MPSPPDLAEREPPGGAWDDIIGAAPAMQEVLRLARQVASSSAHLLLLGEPGAGKRAIARAIHRHSAAAAEPLHELHCGVDDGRLTELLDPANEAIRRGTLLLVDVHALGSAAQVRLLRALEDGQQATANVRVIGLTDRDLFGEVTAGRFREDLYYLLSVVPIRVPALRMRVRDIPALAEYFLRRWNCETASAARGEWRVEPAAMAALEAYSWPGNVRELQNCLRRAIALCGDGEITADALPPAVLGGKGTRSGALGAVDLETLTTELVHQGLSAAGAEDSDLHARIVDRVERELIVQVLAACGDVQTKAAARLGINRNTLHKKMQQFGLEEGVRDEE